jgi:hypothetical protein
MNRLVSLSSAFDHAPAPSTPESCGRPLVLRAALVLAIAMAAATTVVIAMPFSAGAGMDPDLVRLLRAMVGIKGLIALAAAGLVFLRLGHAIRRPVVVGYCVAICVSVAALVWLWSLANVPLGSLCFYGGLAGLVLVARADSNLWEIRRR